jgi:hypothetical protein
MNALAAADRCRPATAYMETLRLRSSPLTGTHVRWFDRTALSGMRQHV